MSFDLLDQVEASLAPTRVSIDEFAEDPKFCDKPLYPRQRLLLKLIFLEELTGKEEDILDSWIAGGRNGNEIIISPDIRDRRYWLLENGYTHFREVDLVGGRRASKGFITGISLAKVMFETMRLEDPGDYYGIDSDKDIYFSCVAGSEDQAKKFQYADFASTVESCKAFEPYLQRSLETEFRVATAADLKKAAQMRARQSKLAKDIARLRGNALAANAGTLRGSATMALAIDEMAHMIPGESKASADEVYKAAVPSLDQFGIDSMIFCNSSPYTKIGMFYERVKEAMKPFNQFEEESPDSTNGNPRLMAFQYPSWALFDEYHENDSKYRSGLRFHSAIMASPDWDPHEKLPNGKDKWSSKDKAAIATARKEEAANPDTYKVERRGKFAEITDAYLNPDMVDRMYAGIPDGFEEELDINGEVIPKLKLTPISTNYGAGAHNYYRYKAHLDPSSTTAGFGFALGHTEEFADYDGMVYQHVVFDIIKRWDPKTFPGQVIKWEPILQELVEWCDIFRPFELTMDQHQSMEPIQDLQERLNKKNINTRVYMKYKTNEDNWKDAETFKTALYQGLVHAPSDGPPLPPHNIPDTVLSALELKFLQEKPSGGRYPRIDKQDSGPIQTKDMADCIMDITNTLIGNQMVNRNRDRLANSVMALGAQGGFGIGKSGGQINSSSLPESAQEVYRSMRVGEQSRAARVPWNTNPGSRSGRGRGRGSRGNAARW